MKKIIRMGCALGLALGIAAWGGPEGIAEDVPPVRLSDGRLQLTPPADWTPKKPKFAGIVDYEFSVAAVEGEPGPARVIIGGAGGGLEANQRRWLAQYRQPDGARSEDRAKIQKKTLADCTVHLLDVAGTYQAPPFDPGGGGPRENYRLLAAVIDAGKLGSYYVKFYGPAPTIARQEGAFHAMIKSLHKKE
ncbi:MAG: hypothetical protein GTO53_07230 [Planctomycetales bacterium]|nr:hypothetical protein [Planctomycetales bacterium]NIM08929.1 hypothetical protein [Planctomycetales bacterium]NIN08399.1 hypothetical protein [Planctomycetales bacterium]NIN77527.1 hypothetical protein [Planctomycetales bacterium]NIO34699.1 hypothetical protein [Planctomycetales bacterium]